MIPAIDVSTLLITLLDGLSWGIMLILIASGLTLIFGFLEVVNFAHGAFYMLGGYVLYSVISYTGSFWLGVVGAVAVVGILGLITERSLLRPTYDLEPITQLLLLIGVAYLIEGVSMFIWGERRLSVDTPELFTGSVEILDTVYPQYRLFQIIVGVVFIGALWLFISHSHIGLIIRASLSDKTMARALGNDIPAIYTWVFAGGVALAAIAGAFMIPTRGVHPQTGAQMLLLAFIVVVIGGLGSLRGTILAGLLVGFTDIILSQYVSFRLSGLSVIAVLLVVLVIRPRGLFGEAGVME